MFQPIFLLYNILFGIFKLFLFLLNVHLYLLRHSTKQSRNVLVFRFQVLLYLWCSKFILLLSGDIETNPGPAVNNLQSLSICHWNLNSIAAENFAKISLLQAYLTVHKFDIICLSETYLDSTFLSDDSRLSLNGYSLLREDHPSDIKRGGVCVYYKDYLPLTRKYGMSTLNECLICELKIGKKKSIITTLYRSPSQTIEEYSNFKVNLEQTIVNINNSNPYISILIGDFNARNTSWWDGDTDNIQGLDLDEISSHYNLQQIINSPTHILPNSTSCIDLLFTSQPNLITESGVHASLFPRCHHQIIFAKINFKINFPPAYERLIWDYSKANINLIRKSLSQIDWVTSMENLHVNGQVKFLTDCLTNIFNNFVPNKFITCKDKDPPWMTDEIKRACLDKAKIYRHYIKNGRTSADQQSLHNFASYSANLINNTKARYLSSLGEKLNDAQIGCKAYWSILNKFMHKIGP